MESLVPVRMCALGFLIHCLADLFPSQQLPGMSTQIHDEAKQRYACACVLALLFILMKQSLWSEQAGS